MSARHILHRVYGQSEAALSWFTSYQPSTLIRKCPLAFSLYCINQLYVVCQCGASQCLVGKHETFSYYTGISEKNKGLVSPV